MLLPELFAQPNTDWPLRPPGGHDCFLVPLLVLGDNRLSFPLFNGLLFVICIVNKTAEHFSVQHFKWCWRERQPALLFQI
jgi:hypothetical protein